MIHRTYIVEFGVAESGTNFIDIIVEGPVGFTTVNGQTVRATPGQKPTISVNATTGPAGWNTGSSGATDAAYYELLSKTLRIEQRALINGNPNPAFTPRFRLGWALSMHPVTSTGGDSLPAVQLSQSLVGSLAIADATISPAVLADPTYGPVIRLFAPGLGGQTYAVHLQVFGQEDEDGFRG